MSIEQLKKHPCKKCRGVGLVQVAGFAAKSCLFCRGTGLDLAAIAAHIAALEAELIIYKQRAADYEALVDAHAKLAEVSAQNTDADAKIGRAFKQAKRYADAVRISKATGELFGEHVRVADVERLANQHQSERL